MRLIWGLAVVCFAVARCLSSSPLEGIRSLGKGYGYELLGLVLCYVLGFRSFLLWLCMLRVAGCVKTASSSSPTLSEGMSGEQMAEICPPEKGL